MLVLGWVFAIGVLVCWCVGVDGVGVGVGAGAGVGECRDNSGCCVSLPRRTMFLPPHDVPGLVGALRPAPRSNYYGHT